MAYLYILLSALSSVLIAHLLKVTEVKKLRTLPTLTINYLFAGVFAFIIEIKSGSGFLFLHNPSILFFCFIVGAFFIGNFLMYSKSVHANGVGVTISAMRVSLLVPVLVSLFLYDESLTLTGTVGVILVIGALILLLPKKKSIKIGRMDAGWLLFFIFLVAGFADASLKIYEEEFSLQFNELAFMTLVFGSAFSIGAIAMLIRRESFFTAKEASIGCLIGIPNLYSSIFLIYALKDIDGAIAYPMVNVLSVVAGSALGFWFWNDEVTEWQWLGIGIAVIAIILLL
jgi:multidrug transporter EmrE-like cation transporter